MKHKDQFTAWYKQKVESNPNDPPEEAWNNIQDELDINNVWQRISSQLNAEKKQIWKQRIGWYAAAAIILLFLILYPFTEQPSTHSFEQELQASIQNVDTPKNRQHTTTFPSSADRFDRTVSEPTSVASTGMANDTSPASKPKPDENKPTQPSEELNLLNTIKSGIKSNEGGLNLAQLTEKTHATSELGEKEQSNKPRFYAGVSGELGKSWLLNNKTFYSMTRSPYSSADASSQSAFGVSGGIQINPKWAVEVTTYFNGNHGQIYREYIDGKLVTNSIDLNYATFNLKGRYQLFSKTLQFPVAHNLLFGTYVGYLSSASQNMESTSNNIKTDYRNYDIGLLIGYELDTPLFSNFILSTGVQIDPGLINIYQGNEQLPAHFNKTYNASIGVNISIKRNF